MFPLLIQYLGIGIMSRCSVLWVEPLYMNINLYTGSCFFMFLGFCSTALSLLDLCVRREEMPNV